MRLIRVCLVLVLPLAMGSGVLAGQQTQPATAQKPAQTSAAKNASAQHSPATPTKRATSRHTGKSEVRRGAKRREYRPAYRESSVEVINGDATKKVVFHDGQAATTPAKHLPASLKIAPQPMKVEVVNGTATDTQYFYDNGQEQIAARNQPVVIGIQSSDTRFAGGNKHPVVTSVTASGAADARSASSGGQPVTKNVSPHPKRPNYQPDAH